MTKITDPESVTILHDGLPVAFCRPGEELRSFQLLQGQSMDWALTYEGYSVENNPLATQGWKTFDLYRQRRGYGVNGALARMTSAIDDLVTEFEKRSLDTAKGQWRDYVAAPHIAELLSGFIGLLGCTDPGDNSFDAIRGGLDTWARGIAERIGYEGEL